MTMKTLRNFVGGEWRSSGQDEWDVRVNPADVSQQLWRAPRSSQAEVDAAVAAAKAALPEWKRLSPIARGDIIKRAARIMEARAEELAKTLTLEMGKTLRESLGEVKRAIQFAEYMAEQGRAFDGVNAATESDGMAAWTMRVPIGVVGLITPWNFPVNIPGWKTCSALLCGNTVVLKPAQLTPMTAVQMVECFEAAGLPPGVLNLVMGSGRVVGDALVNHPDVNGISFTGSTEVGQSIYSRAAARQKRVQCEMGGVNDVLVLADADLDRAAADIVEAGFGTTGQRCTAVRRALVVDEAADALTERVIELAKAVRVGPGLDEASQIGPMVDEGSLGEVLDQIEQGVAEGATLAVGGQRLVEGDFAKGFFIQPTVLIDVQPGMNVANTEIFGPVVSILRVSGYDEAMEASKRLAYGLSSAIYTRDIGYIMRFVQETETGVVHVNKATTGSEVHLPFGGAKASGIGPKELGTAMEFFSDWRTAYIRYD